MSTRTTRTARSLAGVGAMLGFVALGLPAAAPRAGNPAPGDRKDLECLIEPQHVVRLGSATDGLLESVAVDRGSLVSKGQVLATLESGAEKAALDLARERARQQGEIAEAQARVDFTRRELERHERLRQQNVVAERLFDEAGTNLRRSTADLEVARERAALAKIEVEQAEAMLERRRVRSPIDGVVTRRLLEPGEYVDGEPIFEVAQVDPLRVEVLAPASLYGQVRSGTDAIVTPEDLSAAPHAARVVVVDPVIDAASSTFGVRLELPNAGRTLPAGLKCRLEFVIGVADARAGAGAGAPPGPAAPAP